MSSCLAFKTAVSQGARCRRPAARNHPRLQSHASRRDILLATSLVAGCPLCSERAALAVADLLPSQPQGFNRHVDQLDAYTFVYPSTWSVVTSTGNDVFYTNPRVADENVFVNLSSPSSTKYTSVRDVGDPEEASRKLERQLLKEFMSTRLGVKRTVEPVTAVARTGADGKEYYDITVRLKSYASRQQLAVSQDQRQEAVELEFDRIAVTTLGTANGRLYQLRTQTPYKRFAKNSSTLQTMAESFAVSELEA